VDGICRRSGRSSVGPGFASISLVVRRSHATFSPLTAGLASPLLRYNLWVLTWLAFLSVASEPAAIGPPLEAPLMSASSSGVPPVSTARMMGSDPVAPGAFALPRQGLSLVQVGS
jgi:hypothetical protein